MRRINLRICRNKIWNNIRRTITRIGKTSVAIRESTLGKKNHVKHNRNGKERDNTNQQTQCGKANTHNKQKQTRTTMTNIDKHMNTQTTNETNTTKQQRRNIQLVRRQTQMLKHECKRTNMTKEKKNE